MQATMVVPFPRTRPVYISGFWLIWSCTLYLLLITTKVECAPSTMTPTISFLEIKEGPLTNQTATMGVIFDSSNTVIVDLDTSNDGENDNHNHVVKTTTEGNGNITGYFVNVSNTNQRIAIASFNITALIPKASSGMITVEWSNLDGRVRGNSSMSRSVSKVQECLCIHVQVPFNWSSNSSPNNNNNNVARFNIWSSDKFVLDEMNLIPSTPKIPIPSPPIAPPNQPPMTPVKAPSTPQDATPTVPITPAVPIAPTSPIAPTAPTTSVPDGTIEFLFRELAQNAKDGSWGSGSLNLPGFDHVAVYYKRRVYECHPGYKVNTTYVSADGSETAPISRKIAGVQSVHTRATFRHYSTDVNTTPVVNFANFTFSITDRLQMMIDKIMEKVNVSGFVSFATIDDYTMKLRPSEQKGSNKAYSNCGLIEWAAELAGVNNGTGFIPKELGAIETPDETLPLLSPQLLYDAMNNPFNASQYITTYFDPVNYLVTDPLGRRSGFVNNTRFQDIPGAIATAKGDVEYLIVSNPIPGEYKMTVYGIPGQKGVASVQVTGRPAVTVRTTGRNDTVQERTTVVPVVAGSRGDVNGDGVINRTDLALLKQKIPTDVDGFANTGDMNADSILNQTDVEILERYLNVSHHSAPVGAPTLSPVMFVAKPNECPQSDSCNAGFFFQRFMMRKTLTILGTQRCIERCVYQVAIRMRKRLKWQCGSCP